MCAVGCNLIPVGLLTAELQSAVDAIETEGTFSPEIIGALRTAEVRLEEIHPEQIPIADPNPVPQVEPAVESTADPDDLWDPWDGTLPPWATVHPRRTEPRERTSATP